MLFRKPVIDSENWLKEYIEKKKAFRPAEIAQDRKEASGFKYSLLLTLKSLRFKLI